MIHSIAGAVFAKVLKRSSLSRIAALRFLPHPRHLDVGLDAGDQFLAR